MARKKAKPSLTAAASLEEMEAAVDALLPAPPLPPPAKEESFHAASCGNCPYWRFRGESKGQQLGLCQRRLLPYVDPADLTPYGPSGKFAVTPSLEVCGEHPSFSLPPPTSH